MATFIEEAKVLLSEVEFLKLENLGRKSADFETTKQEDNELYELKSKVKELINTRDKQKHLDFLADGTFTISDVLPILLKEMEEKTAKEIIGDVLLKVYPKPIAQPTEVIGKFKVNAYINIKKNKETDPKKFEEVELRWNADVDRRISKAIKEGKVKLFVSSLTEFGKQWIKESVDGKGPSLGKKVYPNLNAVQLRFKDGLDKEALIKALDIK